MRRLFLCTNKPFGAPPPYSTMPKNMYLYRTFVSVGAVQVVYVTVASFLLLYMYKRSQGTRGGAT